ncbi:WD40-repeat-containing domain protein [Cantharellus anzutake]|uniref:WD40-repeat-containing domain protein n=1 Tax=Cantharellus anzutake TaxID=1750568 RepID=UPI001903F877|nr:WD40-repeat-containing domain protein [Cantharellus anzutake]KAF8338019.1 WD40-repeat-containing domain protein [Cantharellus anzutake]
MGEFEDEWEDEFEEDENVVDRTADKLAGEYEVVPPIEDEEPPAPKKRLFLPGSYELEDDEVLEPDMSVYEMLHPMGVTWSCLSFDVLRDHLGDQRAHYPATAFIVTGTQTPKGTANELLVIKMSGLHKNRMVDDSDSEDSEDEDAVEDDPVVEMKSIPHTGGVNRVRAQSLPQTIGLPPVSSPYYAASWAETGKVHIWDVRPLIEALNVPGHFFDRKTLSKGVYTVQSHGKAEGFAMDWSPVYPNMPAPRLLTGDIHSKIYLTSATPTGFKTDGQAFNSHSSSVEDIQWSPSESTVFASCSADQSIRIWDVRVKGRKSVLNVEGAHDSDVNVISWNRETSYLLVSGGDEGNIKIWDMRNFKGASAPAPSPVASFGWHTAPITSIEWSPTEESAFAASGADDQITLWDLSVEADDEDVGAKEMVTAQGEATKTVPPQLLFSHQGQKEIKEVHWHQQIPGAVISTAAEGFNVFKTISF